MENTKPLGQQTRPKSGRLEFEHGASAEQASTSQRLIEVGASSQSAYKCAAETGRRPSEKQSRSADGSGLMPIVQRTALEGTPAKAYSRKAAGSAEPAEAAPEKPFKRRIGSNKSSPSSTCQPRSRLQHLALDDLESDSPKGLDRALTPSMLKALRKTGSPLSGTLTSRTPGRAPHFPSSFSQRLSSGNMKPSYENLAASFTEGWSPKRHAAATPQSAVSIRSFKPTASARNSSESELLTIRGSTFAERPVEIVSPFKSASITYFRQHSDEIQSEGEIQKTESQPSKAFEDNVQQILGRKSLSISTSRPLREDESGSHDNVYSIHADAIVHKKLSKHVRCNITRISRRSLLGISRPAVFELYNMKGRMKLYAERDSGSQISFSIYTPGDGPDKKRLEASLVASTFAENQFLLMGTDPASPAAACDPDQDPVIMAVAFGKSSSGLRTVTVLLPDSKATSVGSNDLGSKQHISAHFARLAEGESIKNVRVLRSTLGKELRGSRIARGSVKNVQLQVADPAMEWPGATPKLAKEDSISAKYTGKPAKEAPQPGRTVFEFGRLRHQHEFVCDYDSPTLTAVQALGLAIACSAPKRAFLYL